MKLPNREMAYIQSSKLTDYLLSETHSVGSSKARFLHSVGFDKLMMNILEAELLRIAQIEDVRDVVASPYGVKYVIDGTLPTPAGYDVDIRTVWIIDKGQDQPRFVTAYPL